VLTSIVVEDNAIVLDDLLSRLKDLGLKVIGFLTPDNVIKNVEKLHPDIVFIDIMFSTTPKGKELAKRIFLDYDIPVVFVTAFDESILDGINIDYKYIRKPFSDRDIRDVLESIK
jgi:CheY-like chemotaxis protein